MSIKDYFKTALLLLYRGKKKLIYTIVILLCVIVTIGILIFNLNFDKLFNHVLENNIGFRTITVYPRDSSKSIGDEEQFKNDLTDLLNITHVVDAFDSSNQEVAIFDSSLANEYLDGTVTLNRGTPNTLPTIVAGRGFEEGETGVAIVPVSFFPTFNPELVNREHLINGNTLLGTTFTVYYHDYILDKNGEPQENQTFSKEFKIVGLYNVAERFDDSGVCYIPAQDLAEIADTQKSWTETQKEIGISASSLINVIVDHTDNVNYVFEQVQALGFETSGLNAMFDMQVINIIRIVIVLVLFLTIFTTIVITLSYTKKKINSEEKNIAILRASGYSKKTIRNIYIMESLIHNLLIYIIGAIIMLITFFVATYNVPILEGLDLMMGGIGINIFPFIFTFGVVVIIPSLVIIYNIIRKCNLDIVKLLGSEE
ncbi:MAG: ABC transporter permease [Oscillospiraceae bacterium]|nr:ABC transporter permease [Oscillospiraceae bacterium]